jgi:ABC-type transporter MlaC component
MCSLLKSKVHSGHISASWLGNFRNLARDQAAVRQFTRMVPSILITKLIQALGGGEVSGSFFVDDNATSKGNGVYSVRVTVDTGSKSYTGRAIVHDGGGGKFRLMDVEYMGFSGVNMTKREFQDVLQDEYAKSPTKSMPVTALVDYVRGQSDYQQCP